MTVAARATAALVRVGGTSRSALVFALTPSQLHREFTHEGDRMQERIRLRVPFDVTLSMEQGQVSAPYGVRPELAALETMMREHRPLLFVWGERTTVVRMLALTIREQEFDRALNPLRAVARIDLVIGEEVALPANEWALSITRQDQERTAELAGTALALVDGLETSAQEAGH